MSQQGMSWPQLLSSCRLKGASRHAVDDVGRSLFYKGHESFIKITKAYVNTRSQRRLFIG